MASFRRFFSLVLTVLAVGSFFCFLGVKAAPFWATECEVSQVFKLTRSFRLIGSAYLGSYNVAVTPLTAENKMARICQLYTITETPYVNELDKKVWLFPLESFQFAYDGTPQSRLWTLIPLALGLLLLALAYLLFQEKADRNPR